ncbi:solute carrier family 16 member 6a [Genypterus blacodes]|uniref:solute carrier family 16 member 6a n=1 Tax=Genypterus blacodes TaxID=154954 RepID=UPI003F77028B
MVLCGLKRSHFLGPNVYTEAPDGGWGWSVAVAFFLVEVFTYGTIKSFGIFLQDLMGEFGETNSRVSWIVSICVFVMTFNGPLSSVLTSRFGFQPVVMLGGLLIASGTIATAFTASLNQMYFTYGLVAGIGYSLTFLPTVTILAKYFDRRRSLITAVASTGESLSMFALAPAFSTLRDHVGWRHTMVVIGALQSIIIICGALLRPIVIKPKAPQERDADRLSIKELREEDTNPDYCSTDQPLCAPKASYSQDNELTGDSGVQSLGDMDGVCLEEKSLLQKDLRLKACEKDGNDESEGLKKEEDAEQHVGKEEETEVCVKASANQSKLLDFSILRDCSFICYSLFGLFATLGFFAPHLFIIELSVSRGVERDRATYMLSIMAVSEILGRFSIGWVLNRQEVRDKKLLVLLGCTVVMAVDLIGFTLVTEFYGLAVCCSVYGFFMGTIACTHIPMLAEDDVVGIERMSSAAGVYVFIQSFAGLGGPPLGGVLVDKTQNYGTAFYSCAAGMAVSAVFLALVKPAKKGRLCRCRRPETKLDELPLQNGVSHTDTTRDGAADCVESDVDLGHKQSGKAGIVEEVI